MTQTDAAHSIASLNLPKRYAVSHTDMIGEVVTMYVPGGETTEEPDGVCAVVVKWPDGQWSHHDISDFGPIPVH